MWVGLTKTWNTRCCRPRSSTGCIEAISPGISFRFSTKTNPKRIWLKNWPRRSPSIPQKWTRLCRTRFRPCGRSGRTGKPVGFSNEAVQRAANRQSADKERNSIMIDNTSRQKFFVAVSDCLEKRGFSTHITEEGKLAVRNEKIPGTVKLLCVVEGNGVMYCSSSDLKNVFKKKLLEEVME